MMYVPNRPIVLDLDQLTDVTGSAILYVHRCPLLFVRDFVHLVTMKVRRFLYYCPSFKVVRRGNTRIRVDYLVTVSCAGAPLLLPIVLFMERAFDSTVECLRYGGRQIYCELTFDVRYFALVTVGHHGL